MENLNINNQILAEQYMPYFMADEAEPFSIEAIGYTVFTEDGKSKSCNRQFHIDANKCQYLIEYAVFYDFDIQHLYDLEHVFVYIGWDGEVVDVEASFHGKFLKSMINNVLGFEGKTHPIMYMQPGKHAMMPNPDYFHLYIGFKEACMEQAGIDGFLIAPMFEKTLHTTPEIDQTVRQYIVDHYTFIPTEHYIHMPVLESRLMPYESLEKTIISRMNQCLKMIMKK